MLLLFSHGGGGASVAAVGGEYGDEKKKKRYVAKVGNQLMVFHDHASALNASILSEPKQKVRIAEIKATAKVFKQEAKVREMFKQRDYEQMLRIYEDMRDEEDIELLLTA